MPDWRGWRRSRTCKALDLSYTALNGTGLERGELRPLAGLQSLNLDERSSNWAGFHALSGLTQLQNLSLWNSPVTTAGLAEVQALPRLAGVEPSQLGSQRFRRRVPGRYEACGP